MGSSLTLISALSSPRSCFICLPKPFTGAFHILTNVPSHPRSGIIWANIFIYWSNLPHRRRGRSRCRSATRSQILRRPLAYPAQTRICLSPLHRHDQPFRANLTATLTLAVGVKPLYRTLNAAFATQQLTAIIAAAIAICPIFISISISISCKYIPLNALAICTKLCFAFTKPLLPPKNPNQIHHKIVKIRIKAT